MMAETRTNSKKKTAIRKRKTTKMAKSVKEIKKHEKLYTFLLVLFFFLIFVVIGYFTLRVQSGHISNIKRMESASRYSFYI